MIIFQRAKLCIFEIILSLDNNYHQEFEINKQKEKYSKKSAEDKKYENHMSIKRHV